MSWEELKTLRFKCDLCNRVDIAFNVQGYDNPPGWGYKHPENSYSMFEKSLDLCPTCLAKENK